MYTLREAKQGDFQSLYDIHKSAMHDYVDAVWGWDERDQSRRFREYFDRGGLQVIVVNGEDAGFLHVVHTEDDVDVVNIEIAPPHQGRGIGTSVLTDIISRARDENVSVSLRVLKINEGARRLYERMGFTHYDDTGTHHLLKLEHH